MMCCVSARGVIGCESPGIEKICRVLKLRRARARREDPAHGILITVRRKYERQLPQSKAKSRRRRCIYSKTIPFFFLLDIIVVACDENTS